MEGKYAVTEDLRLWSHAKWWSWWHKWRFLTVTKSRFWYMVTTIRHKHFFVHRLIALVYLPNPENKPFVNHKNWIRDDNRLENLEWCTQSENCLHGYRINWRKLSKQHVDTAIKNFGKVPKKVMQLTKEWAIVNIFESCNDVRRELGIHNWAISQCALWKTKTCHWFVWKYV